MPRSQEFGFYIENLVRVKVHNLPEKANDTGIHDISAEENALDPTETQSIKTSGGNQIDCSDVLRIFDYDMSSGQKHTMLLFRYKQEATGRRVVETVELNMNADFKATLFGSATREQIVDLDRYVKAIPHYGCTATHSTTYKLMAKQLRDRSGGWISYAPKVDSKKQRRLQCSIRSLDTFLMSHSRFVASRVAGCVVRGIVMAGLHEGFGPRQRHKAAATELVNEPESTAAILPMGGKAVDSVSP
jgi:hypothetical protein